MDGPTQGVENNDWGGQGQTGVVQTGIYTSILSQLINKGRLSLKNAEEIEKFSLNFPP